MILRVLFLAASAAAMAPRPPVDQDLMLPSKTPLAAKSLSPQISATATRTPAPKVPLAAISPTATRTPIPAPFDAEGIFAKALQAQDGLASLECELSREQGRPGATPQRSRGRLKFLDPGLARLDLREPSDQKVVLDGRFLWVEMAESRQVMKYGAVGLRESGNFFLDLGSSLRHFGKGSAKKLVAPGPGFDLHQVVSLKLTPRDPRSAGFGSLRLWIDLGNWMILQAQLVQDGSENLLRFDAIRAVSKAEADQGLKEPLKAAAFYYSPPKGYEVFDMRAMP